MAKLIHLLEDNLDIREILNLLLNENFDILSFPDVASFLEGLSKKNPDLFILDVMLPDGNGIEVCSKLRADPKTSKIPIVMMSANYTSTQMSKLCKADDFISKPFDITEFSDRVAILV